MKFTIFTIPTNPKEKSEVQIWTMQQVLDEINRDRSDQWEDYDETDWIEGWNEWVEGEFYHLVGFTKN